MRSEQPDQNRASSRGEPPRPATRGDSDSKARGENKATSRILRILSAFATDRASFGVTELSATLGMSKNMVARGLATLVEQGFVVRGRVPSRYELGYGVVELLPPVFRPLDLQTLCRPFMQQIRDVTSESVYLAARHGWTSIVVDALDAPGMIPRTRIGVTAPLNASVASRAILAMLTDDEVEQFIRENTPLARFTSSTITDPRQLRKEVAAVRERGYAWGYQDFRQGTVSVAFPVLGVGGRPHGAIVAGGPNERMTRERMLSLLPRVLKIVADLNNVTSLYQVKSMRAPAVEALEVRFQG